ncbi:UNVERIFIED_CONTAM: hypothetical protein K2H54_039946 [Gekko kuhli]
MEWNHPHVYAFSLAFHKTKTNYSECKLSLHVPFLKSINSSMDNSQTHSHRAHSSHVAPVGIVNVALHNVWSECHIVEFLSERHRATCNQGYGFQHGYAEGKKTHTFSSPSQNNAS